MNFLEKDLETIIFETPNEKLVERGLDIEGFKKRQLRIGNYGIADIVTFSFRENADLEKINGKWEVLSVNPYLSIEVFELKQKKIDFNTLAQCARYAKGIERYLKYREVSFEYRISLNLIGNEIEINGDFVYLLSDNFLSNVNVFTYEYGFDGIRFNYLSNGYSLIEEGFKKDPF